MADKNMLIVDIDKCTGCYACEVGCQQWYDAEEAQKRVRVRTVGPVKIESQLFQLFYPEFTSHCDLCKSDDGKLPFCVSSCPADAILYCSEEEALGLMSKSKKYQIGKTATI